MCGAGRRKEKYAGDGRRRTSTENGDTSFEKKNNILKQKFASLKNLVSTKMETTLITIKIMIIHVHRYGSRSIFENQLLFISWRLQK